MVDRSKFSKSERKALRDLAGEAWEAELHIALTDLFENFSVWADKGMDSFELSDRIHKFHNGVARELYGRYTALDAEITVSRAIALGILEEDALEGGLREKLAPHIESFREIPDE